jgi:hypothetical protein
MEKVHFFVLAALLSITGQCFGQWKYNDSDYIYSFDSYIDYSKIKTEGQYKSIYELRDYKSLQTSSAKPYKSRILKQIIDCKSSRNQLIALYEYSEKMGNGEIVDSIIRPFKDSDWNYPPPNSISDGLIKKVCGRK